MELNYLRLFGWLGVVTCLFGVGCASDTDPTRGVPLLPGEERVTPLDANARYSTLKLVDGQLVYVRYPEAELVAMELETGATKVLAKIEDAYNVTNDGADFFFARVVGGHDNISGIFHVSLNGGEPDLLAEAPLDANVKFWIGRDYVYVNSVRINSSVKWLARVPRSGGEVAEVLSLEDIPVTLASGAPDSIEQWIDGMGVSGNDAWLEGYFVRPNPPAGNSQRRIVLHVSAEGSIDEQPLCAVDFSQPVWVNGAWIGRGRPRAEGASTGDWNVGDDSLYVCRPGEEPELLYQAEYISSVNALGSLVWFHPASSGRSEQNLIVEYHVDSRTLSEHRVGAEPSSVESPIAADDEWIYWIADEHSPTEIHRSPRKAQ